MDKATFIKRVVQKNQKPHKTQKFYHEVLNDLLTGIQQELAAGRNVHFLGFGTFYTRLRKASKARHFTTKKVIDVPALHLPAFRAGAVLKRAVRGKQSKQKGLGALLKQAVGRKKTK